MKKSDNAETLKIQQGNNGEKIACNAFSKLGRFSRFTLGTYHKFDMVVLDSDKKKELNVQVKTLVPFVKERYWSVTGIKTVEHFLEADEAYIISIPVRVDSVKGGNDLWKFQGRMLRVNTDKLKKFYGSGALIIPMTEEYVEEYYDLDDEECLSLLKYPVSYFTIKPDQWKQHRNLKYSTTTPAK